jgi:hypothetical protein
VTFKGDILTRIQWSKGQPRVTFYGSDGVLTILTGPAAFLFGFEVIEAYKRAVTAAKTAENGPEST